MDGSFQNLRLLVATGMLGGFTTFSSFSLDFATIWERGHMELALGYMAITVVASIGALFAALWLVRGDRGIRAAGGSPACHGRPWVCLGTASGLPRSLPTLCRHSRHVGCHPSPLRCHSREGGNPATTGVG